MSDANVAALILAAGQGTRMKSALPKVLHEIAGKPLAAWPVDLARGLGCAPITLVVGHGAERVKERLGDKGLTYALQAEQLGSGHAVLCAEEALAGFRGSLLLLCGDVPLLRQETLQALLDHHRSEQAAVTVLTGQVDNPYGYGRIIRDGNEEVYAIVEEKDADATQKQVREINSGIYVFEAPFVFESLREVGCDNASGEYYLTDVIGAARAAGRKVCALSVEAIEEVQGINDRVQLASAARTMRRRINLELLRAGVTMIDPETVYIDAGVQVGADSILHPNVALRGATRIGGNAIIETGVTVSDCLIGDNAHLKAGSVLEGSTLGDGCAIGPMAHLRPGTELAGDNKIGNFVETKKAKLGKKSQASHLTYLGDAVVGERVNFGCGTITCNYDGVNKHQTTVGDDVFVGSDVQLIAPVSIGSGSLIGAGSTITTDVPADALAISRSEQKNIAGWAAKKRQKQQKKD